MVQQMRHLRVYGFKTFPAHNFTVTTVGNSNTVQVIRFTMRLTGVYCCGGFNLFSPHNILSTLPFSVKDETKVFVTFVCKKRWEANRNRQSDYKQQVKLNILLDSNSKKE